MMSIKKFDACREMDKGRSSAKTTSEEKKDVLLVFGHEVPVTQNDGDQGVIDEKDVPFPFVDLMAAVPTSPGARSRCVLLRAFARACTDGPQDPMKTRFDGKTPYTKYAHGESSGF